MVDKEVWRLNVTIFGVEKRRDMVRFMSAEGRCVSSAIWRERRCDAEVGERKGWNLPLAATLTSVKLCSGLSSAKTHRDLSVRQRRTAKLWPSCLRQYAAQEKVESLPFKIHPNLILSPT